MFCGHCMDEPCSCPEPTDPREAELARLRQENESLRALSAGPDVSRPELTLARCCATCMKSTYRRGRYLSILQQYELPSFSCVGRSGYIEAHNICSSYEPRGSLPENHQLFDICKEMTMETVLRGKAAQAAFDRKLCPVATDLYSLSLHESIDTDEHTITRVPGGWIYWNIAASNSIFVPYHNEFQPTAGQPEPTPLL